MLNELADKIQFINTTSGFEETTIDNVERKLLLVVSEVAEAQEELRDGHSLTETYYGEGGKPEGFPTECADVVIRMLGMMRSAGIDIDAVVKEKMLFNSTRPAKHGRLF